MKNLAQRLRCEGIFFQGLRRALRGGGVIRRISDFCFSGIARFVSQACHFLDKLPFFVEQPLFEGFGIHANSSIRTSIDMIIDAELGADDVLSDS